MTAKRRLQVLENGPDLIEQMRAIQSRLAGQAQRQPDPMRDHFATDEDAAGDEAEDLIDACAEGFDSEYTPANDNDSELRGERLRPYTLSMKRFSKRELERVRLETPECEVARPQTRGDCLPGGANEERPCPFVSCKYHLYMDVSQLVGSIKLNFPGLEIHELPETCALDVADREGANIDEIGVVMNLTRQAVGLVEIKARRKLRSQLDIEGVDIEALEPDQDLSTWHASRNRGW